MQIRSLMLQRYFFSMRLWTLRLLGSSGELGSEANGERGGEWMEEGLGSEGEGKNHEKKEVMGKGGNPTPQVLVEVLVN